MELTKLLRLLDEDSNFTCHIYGARPGYIHLAMEKANPYDDYAPQMAVEIPIAELEQSVITKDGMELIIDRLKHKKLF